MIDYDDPEVVRWVGSNVTWSARVKKMKFPWYTNVILMLIQLEFEWKHAPTAAVDR